MKSNQRNKRKIFPLPSHIVVRIPNHFIICWHLNKFDVIAKTGHLLDFRFLTSANNIKLAINCHFQSFFSTRRGKENAYLALFSNTFFKKSISPFGSPKGIYMTLSVMAHNKRDSFFSPSPLLYFFFIRSGF